MTHAVQRRRWSLRAACICICIGAFWSASGLLQLHEVFFTSTVSDGAQSPQTTRVAEPRINVQPTRQYGRLVVVLIDALRADMVLGSDAMYGRHSASEGAADEPHAPQELNQHMQYTRSLLTSGRAVGYVAHASVPTVTMPRLKALLSGKPPAFIDILKNFNAAALADENVIQLFRENDYKIVFYGDDTWLKLFPDVFQRYESTSGFYTRDTVEVDDNVTRHLRDELDPLMLNPKSQDWDVLVLHYLGLDHVGHLRGPRSSMMEDKLHEMDDVVKLVYESVQRQDALRREAAIAAGGADDFEPTLIVLCSDHGMSEIGNHGGATIEESSALMAFMRGDQVPLGSAGDSHGNRPRRLQVDLVPTIATLFGLRIPAYSTGLLLDDVVERSATTSPHDELIKALYANLQQLRMLANVKFHGNDLPRNFEQIAQRVVARLSIDGSSSLEEDAELIAQLRVACEQVQERVATSDGSEYDIVRVTAGVTLLLVSAAVSIHFAAQLGAFTSTENDSNTVARATAGVFFVLTIASLSSTSSIENEHATVFFVVTSLLVAMAVDVLRTRRGGTNRVILLFLIGGALTCVRLLRERSQVINFASLNGIQVDATLPGNAFANDDSLSVWSTGPLLSSLELPTVCFRVVIYGTTVWSAFSRHDHNRALNRLTLGCAVMVFTVGMAASAWCGYLIEADAAATSSAGQAVQANDAKAQIDFLARCVYGVGMVLLCIGGVLARSSMGIYVEMALWLLTSFAQKASNVPTLAVLCVLLRILSQLHQHHQQQQHQHQIPSCVVGLLALWLASAAFFALGNSHLVTTVDISQSYHGLQDYSQGIVGFLTFMNVFSGPLVTLVSCVQWVHPPSTQSKTPADKSSHHAATSAASLAWGMLAYQSLRMAVYTIIVYFMRFHLFIWSVFAPKMLLEVVITIVVAGFAFLLS